MKLDRTMDIKSSNSKVQAKVIIEIEHSVIDDIWNADGDKVNMGRKLLDKVWISVYADGKEIAWNDKLPRIITDPELIKKGAYAEVAWRKAYLNETNYLRLMDIVAEMEKEIANSQTDEYKEIAQAAADHKARREAYEASDAYKEEQEMIEAHKRLMRAMDDPDSDY